MRPVVILLCVMAIGALSSGIVGYVTKGMSEEKFNGFRADLFAHSASYFVGFVGSFVLSIWILIRRFSRCPEPLP